MKYPLLAMTMTLAPALLLAACSSPLSQSPAPTRPDQPAVEETAITEKAPPTQETPQQAVNLTEDALKNVTYSGIYDQPVTLADGSYQGEPYVEGGAARPTIQYIEGATLFGDLDGDGAEDAVVFLLERGGGSGAFTWVAAQLNRNGEPVDAGSVWIEDRIGVKSATVREGQVLLEVIAGGPGDASCCGTHKMHKVYALQGGRLVENLGASQEMQRISAADLDGTGWRLVELDYARRALEEVETTLSFQGGGISGSGGCNRYNADFSLGGDNPFVLRIGPIASTRMACPDPAGSQEGEYLSALENVSQWNYFYGRLALYYQNEAGEIGRLLFVPHTVPETARVDTLTGQTWQWISFTNPVENFDIEAPENYTLTFHTDGSLSIKADCNLANANYTDDAGSLQVQVGPSTLALCPAESRSEQYLQYLGFAARYFFRDGRLYIDLFADGGTMEFTPGDG